MHFYSTRTYKTLSRGDFDTQFWRDVVPHEALTHEFLLDELFAVTCFHRASLDEDQPGHWIEMGIQYQTRGLTEFKKILTSIDVHNCGAAFAFASLTTFLAFADIGSGTPDVVSKVIETRNYMKGSGVIYHQAADSIQEGPMNALFRDVDGKDFSLIWNEEARRIHNSEQYVYSWMYCNQIHIWLQLPGSKRAQDADLATDTTRIHISWKVSRDFIH